MRLSIFARLVIGYMILFGMFAGLSLYFIYHLGHFNRVTRSIILDDTSVMEYYNQLTDALLAETRHDRKYIVLKDDELYRNHLNARREFNQLLEMARMQTNSEKIMSSFDRVSRQHQDFSRLVDDEREQIQTDISYSVEYYAEEKKKAADAVIAELKKIRQASEENVFSKIVALSASGDRVRNAAIVISLFALSTGLVVAFIITRSIKKPLDVMRAKTVEISHGNFNGDLDVNSPPVISELAAAINSMCRKLQKVDDIKSDFFSYMSHELRTPLTSIKGGTTVLLETLGDGISEKQRRILQIIAQESNRLIEQVNSLLDLSKMEAGMMTYQFNPTDLAFLIRSALGALAPLAEAKRITIENNIGKLPQVNADQERMLQVMRNIIGNAVKFTPEHGTVRLEAEVKKNCVEVAVHDTGIGIPEEDLDRIFFKFQQIVPAKGEKIKGTGLGLAAVKQIILAHGGKVWATSRVGKGSTFYFTLPFAG